MCYSYEAEGLYMKERRIRQHLEQQINQILHSIHTYDQTGKNAVGDKIDADDVLAEIVDVILSHNKKEVMA